MAAGPDSGAHNFLEDPASNAPKTGGRDFTTESRDQKQGRDPSLVDQDSKPQGGPLPYGAEGGNRAGGAADGGTEPRTMPFKNLK